MCVFQTELPMESLRTVPPGPWVMWFIGKVPPSGKHKVHLLERIGLTNEIQVSLCVRNYQAAHVKARV